MSTRSLIVGVVSAALLALPTLALADGGPPAADNAKAYGKLCQGESKKHVAGEKGTPFSQCVTAMAKIASGETDSPTKACKGLSKKHVAGERGTPFSRCVTAAAKLREAQDGDE
jgi:hypothetical protein